jgi:hypothetical protein
VRRLAIAALLAALVLASAGCKRKRKQSVQAAEDDTGLAAVVHTADPRRQAQLVSGFHDIEHNSWRWTMGRFSVTLRVPPAAKQKGAVLNLKFAIPEPVLAKHKSLTLSASAQGTALPPQTYTTSGEQLYSRDLPANLAASDALTVEFALDKVLEPGEADTRELGVVATSIAIEVK